MDAPFTFETRAAYLDAMAAEPVDLLIIGGGVTGAGIARDAAMRGIRTAIVDKGDFGCGTSSRSSRLVHGGLRYLEHGHLRLVFEASRERRILQKIAPHLVWPRSFLFPVHGGGRVPRWKLEAGLWLYDVLALFRNVRRHEMLGKRGMLRAEPGLRSKGLKGGARYYDAQCDDARLALANVRDAARHGALVANYAGEQHAIRALAVVNATGPWSDELRASEGEKAVLHCTKGAHIVVSRRRMGNNEALIFTSPIDGRVMFMVPWGTITYIGTTETECEHRPDEVRADADDVIYLLRSVNAYFPEARLTFDDVLATWAGVRPLLRKAESEDPRAVSREHAILESATGLISIVGGKLTTYRKMAGQVVDLVSKRLHELDGRPVPARALTHKRPLPGGEMRDLDLLIDSTEADGLPRAVATHLVHTYGNETAAVARLATSEPVMAEPVVPGHATVWAELVYAMRREMAITLGDLLIRRTHLFYVAPDQTLERAPAVAQLAMREMGWDSARRNAELDAYRYEVARSIAFREDVWGPED
jgi:glycerol-3-phosphate dehydrogenase